MSNPRFSPFALALATLFASLSVMAQDGPNKPAMREGSRPQAVVLATEYQRMIDHAVALDADNDGYISTEELKAARHKARGPRADDRLSELDSDGDGRVSVEEFVEARHARLAKLDVDGDGTVSAEEFKAARDQAGSRPDRRGEGHRGHRADAGDEGH